MDSRAPRHPPRPREFPDPPGCGLLVCLPSISPSRAASRSIARARSFLLLLLAMPILAVSWTARPRLASFFRAFLSRFSPVVTALRRSKPFTTISERVSIEIPASDQDRVDFLLFKLFTQTFTIYKTNEGGFVRHARPSSFRGRTSRGALLDVPANKYVSLFLFFYVSRFHYSFAIFGSRVNALVNVRTRVYYPLWENSPRCTPTCTRFSREYTDASYTIRTKHVRALARRCIAYIHRART